MFILLPFGILLLIIVHLILKEKLTRKKSIICTLVIFLMFPYMILMYKDGGSKVIWAPAYQIIHWNQLDTGPDDPGRKGWEFHIFPTNFHDINYWDKKHKSEAEELITDRTAIDELFEEIMSSPAVSSNPGDYMIEHEDAVSKLVAAKDASLKYIFEEFMKGGQSGLKGHIMMRVLCRIAPEDALDLDCENGQQYFDEWEKAAVKLLETHDYDWVKENHPSMFMLIEMLHACQ